MMYSVLVSKIPSRSRIWVMVLLTLTLALVTCAALSGPAARAQTMPEPLPRQPSAQPNVVFILVDDLDATDLQKFPNIWNQLVRQGTTFSQFFVTNPWCCPSRSSILRSQYMHSHGVESNRTPTGGFPKFHPMETDTLATWMKSAGYRTGLLGKYLNEYPNTQAPTYVPPGWDEWAVPVTRLYAEYRYALNDNGVIQRYGDTPGDYLEDVLSSKAADFVSKPGPFFLYLAPVAPHRPAHYAPRHAGAFAGAQAPRTPSFDQADLSAEPEWLRGMPPLSPKDIRKIDRLYQNRMRAMLGVDDMVGDLVAALTRTGRIQDTYIFFTSDNGFHLGQHRLRPGKTTPFEEDIRVPMVARGPGIPAGATTDRLASTVDLAPTFAELGGAGLPWFAEGRSLMPLLHGQDVPWRDAVLVEFAHAAYEPKGPPSYAVLRTPQHSYVEYATGERQLYDLAADPHQLRNLAATADPALIERLSARLAALRACTGASCRAADM
jgi:arylsulfatase A-like enzyme